MKYIIGKVINDEVLTDDELIKAISWFKSMEENLLLLGDKFYIARTAILIYLIALDQIKFHRGI